MKKKPVSSVKKIFFLLIGAFFVFSSVLSCGEDPGGEESAASVSSPADFAGTLELAGNPGSLLSFPIPEEVYRGLERPDMGDMRIYDSRGNPAPFLVRGMAGTAAVPPEQNVPLLVWNEKARRFTGPSADIEINVSGIGLTINPLSGGENSLYLADLSGFEEGQKPSKLVLDFEGDEFFNASLSIRKSDDLAQWENYGKIQTAAFFNNPGTDRNEFDIPQARYMLLDFDGTIPQVNSALVRFDPVEIPPAPGETSFAGIKSADGKFAEYRTEGRFPVVKLRFSLSRPDSIRCVIRERESGEDPWRYAGEESIYRIETPGQPPLTNGPADLPGAGPHWELEALGEQLFTEVPQLTLLWETRELVFLASGEGPWTLAYGSGKYGPVESSLQIREGTEIFPALPGRGLYRKPETAGAKAGTEKWKQTVLWGVLGLAAAVLSVLALYVIKSIKNGG
jgi:hypothetical protein